MALEEELRAQSTALEAAANAIVITDLTGAIQSVNPAFTVLTGYTAQEAVGQNPRILKSGNHDEAFYQKLWQTISSGRVWHGELVNRRKDGSLYTEEMTITPVRGADGKIARFVAIKQDITERKQVEENSRWKTALLEAQVNSSIDGILVVDQQGKKVIQNQRVTDLFKIPRAIADGSDDAAQVKWVTDAVKTPGQFADQVAQLYSHPDEISRDEIELKDGTILDRYSAPVVGMDGKHHGRIWTFRDITGRRRAEEALKQEHNLLRTLIDHIPDYIYVRDFSNRFVVANESFARLMGVAGPSALIGKRDADFYPPSTAADFDKIDQEVFAGCPHFNQERVLLFPNGQELATLNTKVPFKNDKGEVIGLIGVGRDITERKRLETHLIQSQKMETVGKLAGGIAHEFNSILTVIIGEIEMLLDDLPAGSPLAKNAARITKSANRAAMLTRQLLAYGRKQLLQPEALDLNGVIAGMEGVLSHLLGTDVDAHVVPAAGLQMVKADAGQIEQVIMNLAMNARDAMPHGGKLTLETANVTLDQEYVSRFPELKPGLYVMLAITDTGRGMSEKVKAHAFEPFFTTKDVGQGTGLGLSTCYGIIKQSGGHISVYSEPGRGTTFKIYLPQVEPQAKIAIERLDSPDLPRGTETILLVEDDPDLREMAATLLRRLGYTVLAAARGTEALSLEQPDDIGHVDLLFTDVVMPHMSGKELSDRVRASYPHTRILFTSAFTENAVVHQGVLDPGVAFLSKPYTPGILARKLRETLDTPGAAGEAMARRRPDPAQKHLG